MEKNKNFEFIKSYLKTYTIDEESLEIIKWFLILWNLFERDLCQRQANFSIINKAVSGIQLEFDDRLINDIFSHFREIYVSDGKVNRQFESLKFFRVKKEIKNFTVEILENKNGEPSKLDKLSCVFHIIYRHRNNLFHGEKQIVDLSFQIKKFEKINEVLKEALIKNRLQ